MALAFGAMVTLATGCASSGAQDAATPQPSGLKIPTPFEVGQEIGAGDVSLDVRSFERNGRAVSVVIDVTNEGTAPVTIDPTSAFKIFYGTGRHPATGVDGPATPIPPASTASFTASFEVPPRYKYPLVWFTSGTPGAEAITVVLRRSTAG